ncbi:MAG TPA: CHAT domain-containing protein, partial [Pirellulales bacterium]|nr:CHAT domain-containing protein [Pirellulales bacterium]
EAAHRQRMAELAAEEQELSRQVNLAAGRPALDDPWVETSAVRSALSRDSVLVDLVRFEPYLFTAGPGQPHWEPARYVAWLVPSAGQGRVRIVDLGEAKAIDQATAAARRAIETSAAELKHGAGREEAAEQKALAALTALAQRVLHPLLPALAGARELVISPDSQLWLVPWAALPLGDAEYAIERFSLRYVTSGRDLVLSQLAEALETPKSTRPQIFADPDYDLDGKASEAATRAVLRGREKELTVRAAPATSRGLSQPLARLRATALEARLIAPAIAALGNEPPTVYCEQYALEGVLKLASSPRVLVISTHGFYLPEGQLGHGGGQTPAVGDRRSGPSPFAGTALDNPLLRCGLALAGCNRPHGGVEVDDGILTGMEIVGCDLRGTELVVLSACATGLGEIHDGEGVAGLRQAFQLAGARAVVSTLWQIPNQESVELVGDFFSQLAAGASKAEALRAAQLTQIHARRHEAGAAHPFFWAAFTVTGK